MKDALLATGAAFLFAVLLSSPTFADTPDQTQHKHATNVRPLHSTQADSQPVFHPADIAH